MPAWIVHAPYSHTDGRDYRPGDTVIADNRPNCDCTPMGGEEIAGSEERIQAEFQEPPEITDDDLESPAFRTSEPVAATPRRTRKAKA